MISGYYRLRTERENKEEKIYLKKSITFISVLGLGILFFVLP